MLSKLLAYIKLIRPVNFVISFITIIIAGLICNNVSILDKRLLLAAFAGALTGAAGNVINDYFDVNIDKINKPNRVLAKGEITKNNALIFYFFLLSSIFFISINLNLLSILIVLIANISIYFYSYLFKKVILVGNFIVAFFTGLAFVFGAAATGSVANSFVPALLAFFINFIREIIKDAEDINGDNLNDVITFPIFYGLKATQYLILSLSVVLFIIAMVPYFIGLYNIMYLIVIIALFSPILIYTLVILMSNSNAKAFAKISNLLKVLMVVGLFAIYIGAR